MHSQITKATGNRPYTCHTVNLRQLNQKTVATRLSRPTEPRLDDKKNNDPQRLTIEPCATPYNAPMVATFAPRPRAALHFFIGFSMLNQMLPRPTSSRQHYYRQPYPLKFQHFYNLSTHMLNSPNPRSGRSDATLQLEPLGCRLHKYVLHTSTHFYACVTSTMTFAPQQLSGPSLCLCSLLPLWPQ